MPALSSSPNLHLVWLSCLMALWSGFAISLLLPAGFLCRAPLSANDRTMIQVHKLWSDLVRLNFYLKYKSLSWVEFLTAYLCVLGGVRVKMKSCLQFRFDLACVFCFLLKKQVRSVRYKQSEKELLRRGRAFLAVFVLGWIHVLTVMSPSPIQVPQSWAAGSCVPPVTSPTAPAAAPSPSGSWCARGSASPHTSCPTPSSAASGGGAAPRTTAASRRTPGCGGSSCSVPTATLGLTKSAWSPPASASASGHTTTSQKPKRCRSRNATRSTVGCLKIEARTTRHWQATRTDAAVRHPQTERPKGAHTHVTHKPTNISPSHWEGTQENKFIS